MRMLAVGRYTPIHNHRVEPLVFPPFALIRRNLLWRFRRASFLRSAFLFSLSASRIDAARLILFASEGFVKYRRSRTCSTIRSFLHLRINLLIAFSIGSFFRGTTVTFACTGGPGTYARSRWRLLLRLRLLFLLCLLFLRNAICVPTMHRSRQVPQSNQNRLERTFCQLEFR